VTFVEVVLAEGRRPMATNDRGLLLTFDERVVSRCRPPAPCSRFSRLAPAAGAWDDDKSPVSFPPEPCCCGLAYLMWVVHACACMCVGACVWVHVRACMSLVRACILIVCASACMLCVWCLCARERAGRSDMERSSRTHASAGTISTATMTVVAIRRPPPARSTRARLLRLLRSSVCSVSRRCRTAITTASPCSA